MSLFLGPLIAEIVLIAINIPPEISELELLDDDLSVLFLAARGLAIFALALVCFVLFVHLVTLICGVQMMLKLREIQSLKKPIESNRQA